MRVKNIRFASGVLFVSAVMLVGQSASAQVVTTVAGSGIPGSVDGNGAEASFFFPLGLSVGPGGDLYIADTLSLKIRKITPQNVVTTVAGSGLPGYDEGIGKSARFFGPLDVAADSSGNVWVADQDDGIDGQFVKRIVNGAVMNLLLYPGFNPIAMAVPSSGSLYVLDLDGRLWRIPDPGKPTRAPPILLTTLEPAPYFLNRRAGGLAVDSAENVYFSHLDRIWKLSSNGTVTVLAGSGLPGSADGPGQSASFRDPEGLAIDSSGNVYVADSGNNRIRKVTPAGIVTTVAGSATRGSADGTGTAASFASPGGVALNASGNLYVADSGNNKIRKITFPGSTELCVSDPATLCLNRARFKVTTQWTTSDGRNGSGHAVPLTGGDTGYFTFFDNGNVEVAVKVLDACSSSKSFWVFAAGLTDVSVGMTVTDTQTGTVTSYTNPQGTPFRPIQDTTTFATCSGGVAAGRRASGGSTGAPLLPPAVTESFDAALVGPCVTDATTVCLRNSRYRVQTRWFTRDGNSGAGQVLPLTADTAAFWFFSPNNLEMVVKVLNGCGVNARYWTFAGGMTDVNVILTVTDTQNGATRTYTNPQGVPFEPIQDTDAFASCP